MIKCKLVRSGIFGIALVFAVTLVFGIAPKAKAGIPVLDGANLKSNIASYVEETISAVQQYASTYQQYYEWAMSFELAALKLNLTQGLTDKVLGYVSGGLGAGGDKKFVTDWKEYAESARNSGAAKAAREIVGPESCSSFRTGLSRKIGLSSMGVGGDDEIKCDFPDGKIEEIIADPRTGSWDDYLKLNKPQNNVIGATLLAHQAQQNAAEDAEKAATQEALAGEGYLGARDSSGIITTPGSTLKGMVDAAVNADYEVIANADQLQNIIGGISGSVINKITESGGSDSGGNSRGDKGLSGVDLIARQGARNITRDAAGNLIKASNVVPNCTQIFADSLSEDQFALFDGNPQNGFLDADEIALGILNYGDEVESGLYDLCLSNSTAGSGNQQLSVDATIKEVITKRKEAQDPLKKLAAQLKATERALDSYDSNGKWVKGKHRYAIDNPNYDSSLPATATCSDGTPVGSCDAVNRFKYLFLDGSIAVPQPDGTLLASDTSGKVNIRKCLDVDYLTARYVNVRSSGPGKDYAAVGFRYIREADPSDPGVKYFVPGVTATSNPAADFKSTRCTVASYVDPNANPLTPTDCSIANGGTPADSRCKLIEAAYYNEVATKVRLVDAANDLAVRKLNAYQKMIDVASKLRSRAGAVEKVAELIADFRCHAGVFACVIPDADQPGALKYPAPQLQNSPPMNADADTELNEAGYYKTDPVDDSLVLDSSGNPIFVHVPNHKSVEDVEYEPSSGGSSDREDNYRAMLARIGLGAAPESSNDCFDNPTGSADSANCIAQRGLITTINQDHFDDDPSNPYYEPAFDLNEATRVYEFSQGNLEVLGDLQPTDENNIANDDPQLDNGEAPAPEP